MHPRANLPESTCNTCAAYDIANSECRRRSPQLGGPVEGMHPDYDTRRASWPMVRGDEWCFDWLPGDVLGQAPPVVADETPEPGLPIEPPPPQA